MSQVTISGAVSGLDTASIINQLVSVQTNQQTLLKSHQTGEQKRADAYAALVSSLNALGSQAAALAKSSTWHGSVASSSATSVTATATGTATGSLTFDVTGVAAAHALISSSALASTGALAASGPLTLTGSDGTTSTIDVGTGSLTDVVAGINTSDSGLTAVAVATSPGVYRLQVTARSTGASSAFTLDGLDGFTGTDVLTQGADAAITVGGNPATAYTVTSSSNTFADLVPGVPFTVSKLETGVTVSAKIDGSAMADLVTKLVDSVNGVLSDIAAKTAYDTGTKTGGPFTGESTVRSLQQNLLSAVSLSGAPGVSLTRDGTLTFDRPSFLSAFSADPAKVARQFGASSTFAPAAGAAASSATVSSALKSARAGTYAIHVDSVAAREQWQEETGGDVAGREFSVGRGAAAVTYTATSDDTVDSVAAAFNQRAAAARIGVTATVNGTALLFTADAAGSANAFTARLDGVAGDQLTAGADISGTIDGEVATGLGNVLSLPHGTGGAVGLSVQVDTTAADLGATGGDLGSLTFTSGLAQRLSTLINDATSATGTVTTAEDGAHTQVKSYQKQIDAWDARLTAYRQTLSAQFTAMETAMAQLKSSMSAISQLTSSSSLLTTPSTSGG
jgi:flagellar hook-associated protein 2